MNDVAGGVVVGVVDAEELVPVVRAAAWEALAHGGVLRVLHAVEWPLPHGSEEAGTDHVQRAERVIAPFAELVAADFPQVRVVPDIVSGSPAPALIRRSHEVSLVVVGHRGSGGLPRLPLGSVALQVATHAASPVLVIRPGEEPDPGPKRRRVAVAVEVGGVPAEVMDFAMEAAIRRKSDLDVIHAVAPPLLSGAGTTGPALTDHQALRDSAAQALERELAAYRQRWPRMRLCVQEGRPASVLVEASRTAVLLVAGTRGRSGLKRLVLGSVSGEVLHHAHCPVAVVPQAPEDEEHPDEP
ncbi:Universal stress protein [Streptomyces sp. ADI95-16]|uniref:universal stress protein n=1 Tax=Streptomyces sp. ADI95-16 TaxID=1522758 RepID=UPI000F4309C1|nr:universal stress protein [Streptomyces sp. ADI95-16]AYV26432.1 Universal stress protein [Streptomyces sp. ADI95-16]